MKIQKWNVSEVFFIFSSELIIQVGEFCLKLLDIAKGTVYLFSSLFK